MPERPYLCLAVGTDDFAWTREPLTLRSRSQSVTSASPRLWLARKPTVKTREDTLSKERGSRRQRGKLNSMRVWTFLSETVGRSTNILVLPARTALAAQ